MRKTVEIEGMMCMHRAVRAKKTPEGVAQAEVTLEPGRAVPELTREGGGRADIDAVKEAGCSVTQIA